MGTVIDGQGRVSSGGCDAVSTFNEYVLCFYFECPHRVICDGGVASRETVGLLGGAELAVSDEGQRHPWSASDLQGDTSAHSTGANEAYQDGGVGVLPFA
ncbi:MAG: hypothetical protein L7V86_20675 [Verrucomicrobiales bacterium]|nr:hypothetical protein [Verrucomicrobiales bacterium]